AFLEGRRLARLSAIALVSLDNAADDRVADHIGHGEADNADPFHSLQAPHRIMQAALRGAAGDVHLPWVAAYHHAAVLAEAGEEHLHLFARGVLRFIEDHERIAERAAAHEGDRRDLDLSAGDAPVHLLGRHA